MTERRGKYNAKRAACECGGVPHWHDSMAERARCYVLHQRLAAREIVDLHRQVPYDLNVNGKVVARYVADFTYAERDADGRYWPVVEDVKSQPTRTPTYRLKRKLMQACHGVEIRETR